MPVEAEKRYEATVTDAYIVQSPTKGTLGLLIKYSTDEGPIERAWYVSDNNSAEFVLTLKDCFGITPEQIDDDDFWYSVGSVLKGKTCSISTKVSKYDGSVEIAWMNPTGANRPSAPKITDLHKIRRFAGLLGGGPVSSPAYKPNALVPRDPAAPTTAPEFSEDVPF